MDVNAMKKMMALLTALLLAFQAALPVVYAEENGADSLGVTAPSAILMEASTGTVVLEKNAHEKLPPASVTKIMTLLLIFDAISQEKIQLDDIRPSSRKYPYIDFRPFREIGNEVLTVENLSKTIDGEKVLDNVSFIVRRGDKIAFISDNELAMTTLFQILMGEMKPDEGSFKWGVTTSQSYFPKDNNEFFDGHEENMLDWIAPYSQTDTLESTLRGFLGRMLFSGDDVYKPVRVLSGGEKVRLMLARMMLFGSNVLVVDQPTNHLDLESITAVNNGVRDFKGTVLFASHDHEFVQTIATRIIEIRETGVLDKECTYDEFLEFRETYKG